MLVRGGVQLSILLNFYSNKVRFCDREMVDPNRRDFEVYSTIPPKGGIIMSRKLPAQLRACAIVLSFSVLMLMIMLICGKNSTAAAYTTPTAKVSSPMMGCVLMLLA